MKKLMFVTVLVAMVMAVNIQVFASLNTPEGLVLNDPETVKFENVNLM